MLETYFSAPKTLRRLRNGISGPHIDTFAEDLERDGYAPASAVRYIRAAAHLGCFVHRRGAGLADIDFKMPECFGRHLRRCRCPHFKRGKIGYRSLFGVKHSHRHLIGSGICPGEPIRDAAADPALVAAFRDWFKTHRGAKEPTLRQYARGATDLLQALGEDVGQWTAQAVRDFLLERASRCGSPTTQKLITSLRAFLRNLNCGVSPGSLSARQNIFYAALLPSRPIESKRTSSLRRPSTGAGQAGSVEQRHTRYQTICHFAQYLRVEDARHELPPANHFGYRKTRRIPRIWCPRRMRR